MIKYLFRDGVRTFKNSKDADPQAIGEELEKISRKNGGRLTPHATVDEARNKRSALHRHFEWDDSVAAGAYRLDQAREIIRSITVKSEDPEEREVPQFISLRDTGETTSYRATEEIQGSSELQMAVLRAAKRDAEAFLRRYREFASLFNLAQAVLNEVDSLLKEMGEKLKSAGKKKPGRRGRPPKSGPDSHPPL